MKTKLEYQSDITETNKLISEKYWLRESDKRNGFIYTCKEIGQDFGLRHQDIPSIVKVNALLVVIDCQCIECGITKICHTRSQLTQLKPDNWRCDECWEALQKRREKEYLEYCLEQECLKKEQKKSIFGYINDHRSKQLGSVPTVAQLSEVDMLLLAATVESLGAENLNALISLRHNLSLPLSPFFLLDNETIKHLFNLNLLILAPDENYDFVTINQKQELDIDYNQAALYFTYRHEDLTKIMVNAKSKKNISALVANKEFESWCHQIQLGECLSYLITRSQLNNLAPTIGEKMVSLLSACLAKCSVSVMHYIIWKAVESAAAFVQKPNITKKHASNSIYGNIERVFGKINNGSWHHNNSYRDASHPQSAIAKVFFDYVFEIEDCGFKYTLDELFNPYRHQKAIKQMGYSILGSVQNSNYSVTINKFKIL
ncbi:hypothetical protein H4W00_001010 [Psychrobacter sp. PL19]|uniref:hypothetical protein n=1 Tax=Psychrobacter sp. PL19 TaxID=2760711 RepID=UPI001AE7B85B